MTSNSAMVVFAVEVEGNRSVLWRVPRMCLNRVVFPAPVVPANKAREYPILSFGSGGLSVCGLGSMCRKMVMG